MSTKPKKVIQKRARVTLSLEQKLELLRKLEKGSTVAQVCEEYGCKKQTVSDIRKAKAKLMDYASKYCVDGTKTKSGQVNPRKYMSTASKSQLDAAVLKWFLQQRSEGVNIRGVEIIAAAVKLAAHLGIENFKGSDGWLWRFRNRHGLFNVMTRGESGSADSSGVEPFRARLHKLINEENLTLTQVYNADETGFFWRSMPRNTQVSKHEAKTRGKKLCKRRISALCGANASGTHRLKLCVVGKSKKPHAFKNLDIERDLPAKYYFSKKAWFNASIFSDWFFKYFVPAVIKYQTEVLGITRDQIKAVLLLDNAPAHPEAYKLVSECGKIKVMYLPPNTTSLIQPMDQGIISALKRRYTRKYLNEVLVVIEDESDKLTDTRGSRTLANIQSYNIRSAICNLASAWSELKMSTLSNCWKSLLEGEDADENDFQGFGEDDAATFLAQFRRGGERDVTMEDVEDWLDEAETVPGHEIYTEEEIAEQIQGQEADESSEEEEEEPIKLPKLSLLRESVDNLLLFAEHTPEAASFYTQLRLMKDIIIKKQHQGGKQTKIHSFFTPQPGSSKDSDVPMVVDSASESSDTE